MPDTITTQQPNQLPHTRPVPPSWATGAPLLEPPASAGAAAACPCVKHRASSGASQGQIALVPHRDGSWMVLSGYPQRRGLPRLDVHDVPFAGLPAAIADLAARCEASEKETR